MPREARFMSLKVLREKMLAMGYTINVRSLQRWASTKRIPCVRGINKKDWLIDLRGLKSSSETGRALYEELMVDFVNRE